MIFETDNLKTNKGNTLNITFLRHASFFMEIGETVIYSDPVSKFDDIDVCYKSLPKADLILVSHDHFDHLDADAINTISKNNTIVICNEQSSKQLDNAIVMKNGDTRNFCNNSIKIEAVPAYNITEGHTQFHPKFRDNGYILTIDDTRIYIAGDTEDIAEMNIIKNIDIAFLPVNQPYTMTLEQAAKAIKTIKPKIFYPYHFTDTEITRLPNMLINTGIDVRLRKMM